MNQIRAFLSAGRACLRRAWPTNATEGAQSAVARWLIDGKVCVRYGADVPYPKLRLSPAAAEEDGWGVTEVEVRQPDGRFATSRFRVEILTHRSDAPDDVVIISKDELASLARNVSDRGDQIQRMKNKVESRLAAVNADLDKLEEKKSGAPHCKD
ncbi:unnamed protein product [Linum tenue]|uniref:Uncharacterized protein n=1 Tax=Linum tenue TaxID=586396 RepID=A0AAV0RBM7_9ROSI|nr:unnamed protein product [Linum tenue]